MRLVSLTTTLILTVAFVGCAGDGSGTSSDVISMTTTSGSIDAPVRRSFAPARSVLIGFDSPRDLSFVESSARSSVVDGRLRLEGDALASIALGAAALGRSLPGEWSLIGLTIRAGQDTTVNVAMVSGERGLAQRAVRVRAGLPSEVYFPAKLLESASVDRSLRLLVQAEGSREPIEIDDVRLTGRPTPIVTPRGRGQWSVTGDGARYRIDQPAEFFVDLDTDLIDPDGWRIVEASAFRTRFENNSGKTLTIDSRGRSYWSGVFKPLSATAREQTLWVTQHDAPPRIDAIDETTQILFDAPCDKNHDGYDESRGTCRVKMAGTRAQLRLKPAQASSLLWPVIEVEGLPESARRLSVVVEGSRIDRVWIVEPGRALIELPLRISRPIEISVRVES